MKHLIIRLLKINTKIYTMLSDYYYSLIKKRNLDKRIKAAKTNPKNRSIFFLLDQKHGNLGDQAIGWAEEKYVRNNINDCNVICVLEKEYKQFKSHLKRVIKRKDIIGLIGGGSLGNIYLDHENSRRDIINTFKKNKIISFPQTMYFTKDQNGQIELQKSVDIYSKHADLSIFAREETSYETMLKEFKKNQVFLAPDIVFYLDESQPEQYRKGALCCLRSDREKKMTEDEKEKIVSVINQYYDNLSFTDMCVNKIININEREQALKEKFKQFRSAEIVITDRLHGLIFSAITATPCIAFNNFNHKIKETYQWIKTLDYIKFANSYDDIQLYLEEIKKIGKTTYQNDFCIEPFNQIKRLIISG